MTSELDAYRYTLPDELVAQYSCKPADVSRMMVLPRGSDDWEHRRFQQFPQLLPPRSLLVVNDTRVQPCLLEARLPNGVLLEALLTQQCTEGRWQALIKRARRVKSGMLISFARGDLKAVALERCGEHDEQWLLEFENPKTLKDRLQQHGLAPLPPYIRRLNPTRVATAAADKNDYQTIFARCDGSIAAPTAAMHFTARTLKELQEKEIKLAFITLHIGVGTFTPLTAEQLKKNQLAAEWINIPTETVQAIKHAKKHQNPVVAIGTTTVRALETWGEHQSPAFFQGNSLLFIRPGHRFLVVDGLLTNFHLPASSLILLTAAFHGRTQLLNAYHEAIQQKYRFYSYGDCMLIKSWR